MPLAFWDEVPEPLMPDLCWSCTLPLPFSFPTLPDSECLKLTAQANPDNLMRAQTLLCPQSLRRVRGLGGVAAAERGLVQNDRTAAVLEDRVRRGEPRKATANHLFEEWIR